jgi:hypothetical protein
MVLIHENGVKKGEASLYIQVLLIVHQEILVILNKMAPISVVIGCCEI